MILVHDLIRLLQQVPEDAEVCVATVGDEDGREQDGLSISYTMDEETGDYRAWWITANTGHDEDADSEGFDREGKIE